MRPNRAASSSKWKMYEAIIKDETIAWKEELTAFHARGADRTV